MHLIYGGSELLPMRSVSILLFCSACLLFSRPVCGQDSDLRGRFLKEAPAAWTDYAARASHVQGQGAGRKVDLLTGKTILEEGPITVKIDGSLAVAISASNPKRLSGKNEDYEFVIESALSEKWSIVQLLRSSTPAEIYSISLPRSQRLGSSPWQRAMSITCRGLLINDTWLPAMTVDPSFKITSVSATSQNKQDVRVDFQYDPSDPRAGRVRGGYVVLDPSRYWLIKTMEVDAYEPKPEFRYKMHFENEFDDSTLGYPFVTKQELRSFKLPILDHKDVYSFNLQKLPATDVASFRLPGYGIPEPEPLNNRKWFGFIFWNMVIIFFPDCRNSVSQIVSPSSGSWAKSICIVTIAICRDTFRFHWKGYERSEKIAYLKF